MVDFNTETAINTPAKNIEAVLLFEKREYFLQAKESYKILEFQGSNPPTANLRARLLNLIDQWFGYLNRVMPKEVELWIKIINNDKTEADDIIKIFYDISVQMDKSNLTKIDRVKIDRTLIENENNYTGLD